MLIFSIWVIIVIIINNNKTEEDIVILLILSGYHPKASLSVEYVLDSATYLCVCRSRPACGAQTLKKLTECIVELFCYQSLRI